MMKKTLCLMAAICLANVISGTNKYPMLKESQHFDCINYEANRLIFPGDSGKFEKLYKKLDSLAAFGSEKINIVNIGGSHIQADVFSNRLRMNLVTCLPGIEGERGLIFPFKAAKTNNPRNFKITASESWTKCQNSVPPIDVNLGIAGYAISTNDTSAYITFDLNPQGCGSRWNFDRLRLLGSVNSETLMPLLVVGNDTITAIKEDDSYVFDLKSTNDHGKIILWDVSDYKRLYAKYKITDSKKDEALTENKPIHREDDVDQTYSLNIGLESDYGLQSIKEQNKSSKYLFTITGLLPENGYNGITFHSLGVNGASLKSWLRCKDFESQMHYLNPDLAILSVGINDANVPVEEFSKETYKYNYEQLIEKIYAVNPDCAIIFMTNNDCVLRRGRKTYGINKNGKTVQKAIYELAQKHGAAVWDLFEIMGGEGAVTVWKEEELSSKDRVHFMVPGYNILGDLIYNAIIYDWLYKTDRN